MLYTIGSEATDGRSDVMSSTSKTAGRLSIPPEVQADVARRGLGPYLPALGEILQRIFADASKMGVEVHEDPEIADLSWIVFTVEGPWKSFEEENALRKQWYHETAVVCPKHLLCDFALHLNAREA
jgi:hypothetical protein